MSEDIFDGTHKKSQKSNAQRGTENGMRSLMNGGKIKGGEKRKGFSDFAYKCLYHEYNSTHDTNKCKVMIKQAHNIAATHTGKGGKNKWTRFNNEDSKEKKKVQYQSFVANVAQQMK